MDDRHCSADFCRRDRNASCVRRIEFPACHGCGQHRRRHSHTSSSSLEYTKLKVEKAAEFARALPETKATNSNGQPGGGRIYVDIGKSTERKRSAAQIANELRESLKKLVGPSMSCWTTSTTA